MQTLTQIDSDVCPIRAIGAAEPLRPATLDQAARTVEVVWSTGAARRIVGPRPDGSFGAWVEELDLSGARLERLNSGAPVLDAHQRDGLARQIGVVVPGSARVVDGVGVATVRFSARPEVEPIWRDVVDGVIRHVSVGYQVARYERVGERDGTPVYRAVDWEPWEISLVPVPADPGAQIREQVRGKNEPVPVANHITTDILSTGAYAERSVTMSGEQVIDQTTVGVQATDPLVVERQRVAEILQIGQRFQAFDLAQRAIADGSSVDQFRAALLDKLAERAAPQIVTAHAQQVRIVSDEKDKILARMSDAILLRANAPRQQNEVLDPGEYGNYSLLDMAREVAERSGMRVRGVSAYELVGELFLTRADGPAHTPGDFPTLLANTLRRAVVAAYNLQPVTWRRFCRVSRATDYRPTQLTRFSAIGRLRPIESGGEIERASIADAKAEWIKVSPFGIIVAITRQVVVNDDLRFFDDLPRALAYSAALSVELDVYSVLTSNGGAGPTMSEDGNPLFHASHNNIGTAGAPSVTTIKEAFIRMKAQKDHSNVAFLDNRPEIFLGPAKYYLDVVTLNTSTSDPSQSNPGVKNPIGSMFRDVIDSAHLGGNRWYVFANPETSPTLEVAFLNGRQEPTLERQEGWTVDGIEYRVKLDYGIAAADWRHAFTNPGA